MIYILTISIITKINLYLFDTTLIHLLEQTSWLIARYWGHGPVHWTYPASLSKSFLKLFRLLQLLFFNQFQCCFLIFLYLLQFFLFLRYLYICLLFQNWKGLTSWHLRTFAFLGIFPIRKLIWCQITRNLYWSSCSFLSRACNEPIVFIFYVRFCFI